MEISWRGRRCSGLVLICFQLGVFALSVFFFLYYGEEFAGQVRAALHKMDPRTGSLLLLVHHTVIRVLYGLVFTAVAQGLLAGLGFTVAGVQAPTVLGVATMFLSFVPFGPQLIYVPVAIFGVFVGPVVVGLVQNSWLAWTVEQTLVQEDTGNVQLMLFDTPDAS